MLEFLYKKEYRGRLTMKMSKLFVQTLREFPSDAEVISHKMLVRAGYIRKLTSGVYNYLPLMWRVLKKIENIVREEMDNAGAQELLMPFVQPKELFPRFSHKKPPPQHRKDRRRQSKCHTFACSLAARNSRTPLTPTHFCPPDTSVGA